ncbi:MAG: Hint domain-containing protein [Gemmobacter sp.]
MAQSSTTATRTETPVGLPMGTLVLTLDGALPVEHLGPGDRIVTRAGVRRLRAVTVTVLADAAMVAVAPGALGHDRPDRPLMLPAGQAVLLRDWRARAMFGTDAALVAVGRLADGVFLRHVRVKSVRLFALTFDAPAVIYADGVETGAAAVPVPA